ncbi:mucin-22 [Asbolus verrucosus]|uniref:Mucin-22 n=1 Tax=Asbolus verrucosus TaxID=1661398 RepID=A0A482VKS5_ASBVE|nr:mucin-22 [Asbolus verrucosus]
MGFTVRFMLGTVLVLLCCWSIETTSRRIRQTNNGESKTSDKLQKIEEERTTQHSIVANLSDESNKPKTDFSTEDNKTLDKQNSLISKLPKSETYKKATNQPEIKREEIARSIDIEKYVSKEFHNKNNVYTLPASPDTEKYIDHDYSFHSTTRQDHDHTKEFQFESELTTPKSLIFDHKYKEAVESVEQKLEHIDNSHELSSESESSKENLDLEKLYDETKNNDTRANLDFINYKNIISNDTTGKNSLHKDLVVEAGTNLDFHSSYNETTIIDQDDDGNNTIDKKLTKPEKIRTSTISNTIPDQDRSESSTTKTLILTTRKSLVLTKPPTNRNSSHISILSNNIETETVKAINNEQLHALITTEKEKGIKTTTAEVVKIITSTTTEKSKEFKDDIAEERTRRTPIDITKRGSIKFVDYTEVSTEPTLSFNEIKKKTEQLFQENQIVPVHVEAPSDPGNTTVIPSATTSKTMFTTKVPGNTTIIPITTTSKTILTTEIVETTTVIPITTSSETILPTESVTTTTEAETEPVSVSATNEATTTVTAELQETTILTPSTIVETVETTTEQVTTVEPTITTNSTEILQNNISVTEDLTTTTTTARVDITTDFDLPTTTSEFDSDTNATTPSTLIISSSTTNVEKDVIIITETSSIANFPTSDFDKNAEITTNELIERTTEEILETTETRNEPPTTTTTEANYIVAENRTNLVPELKQGQNDSLEETATTTENITISSDSYELNTIPPDDNSGTIAAITISSIGAVCLILLAGLLIIMRKRQKRFNYGQRCTPVSLDDYSMDNVSVYNSVRRKGMLRSSKRSYGNPAFEDPASVSHPLNFPALGKFANNLEDMRAEFEEIPQITARTNELPEGCDTKNRYANVIPLPETRVFLTFIDGYPNSDYINANYVTGPKNTKGYYIACQAPMQNTVDDFWRMIWEQQSKVILMLTHLFENGVEKCVDYLPPSEVLDCHRAFGDFLVTLKKREVKDKYIISILQLKVEFTNSKNFDKNNMVSSSWREVTHFWYLGWPEKGVPSEANSLIAFLIEARSYMKSSSIDRKDVTNGNLTNGAAKNELNPVVVHCSPGTGRTGVVIACDIAIREFEQTRLIDVPRIVYKIRRDRASSVQTKEQYAFIYKVINLYATKLTGGALDSL